MFIAAGGFGVGLGLRTRTGFPILFGSLFGGAPLVMALIPGFSATPYVLIPLALAMIVVGYRKGKGSAWGQIARASSGGIGSGGRGWKTGGSTSTSSGSSRSSSSRSSSRSSSFGGGRSGGGGASGRW